jgi:hypothetical protein
MTSGHPTAQPYSRASLLAKLTGAATLAAGALLYGNATSQLQTLTLGTAGKLLVAGASAPAWSSKLAEGTITGLMTLSKTGSTAREMTFPDAAIVVAGSASALTSGRIPFVTTGGLLTDSSGLKYASNLLTVGSGVDSSALLYFDGAAASQRGVQIRTAGVARWIIDSDTVAETGSNAGCAIQIRARDDAGAQIDTPLSIVRAAGGAISLGRPLNAPYKIYIANTNNDSFRTTGGIELGQAGSVSSNAYYSSGWKYRGANYATAIVDNGSSGLEFRSAVSGTADAALTWVAGLRVSPTAVTALLPVTVSNTTSATSGTTGALIVAGGVGAARPSYFATATSGYTLTLANSNGESAPGLQILAGVSTDNALLIRNAADTVSLFRITGAGDATFAGGTVTGPNGTAAAPGFRLTTEAHGLYRVSATNLGFTVAGTAAAQLSSSGSLVLVGGVSATTLTSTLGTGLMLDNTAAGTGNKYARLTNDGGAFFWGLERSTGGSLLTGTAAYSTVFGTTGATALHLGTNGAARLTLSSAGVVSVLGTADGILVVAGKITAKAAVPASFADLAAVQTYLASILT